MTDMFFVCLPERIKQRIYKTNESLLGLIQKTFSEAQLQDSSFN